MIKLLLVFAVPAAVIAGFIAYAAIMLVKNDISLRRVEKRYRRFEYEDRKKIIVELKNTCKDFLDANDISQPARDAFIRAINKGIDRLEKPY